MELLEMVSAFDTIWVLIGTVLVFFMQAGFAMVETGFTRAKNAGNIIMKNLMDFAIGSIAYWAIGFSIMYSSSKLGGVFGINDLFLTGSAADYTAQSNVSLYTAFMFQTVFAATAATIVSGAMAERTKFISYCIYSFIISLLIYPIEAGWIWSGEGWLAKLSFHDFAGSTAVHMCGGVAALVGAIMLGARIGKYDEKGKSKAIPGHSLTLGALGVFILWFCWFGFNGGSTLGYDGEAMGRVFMTTNIAAASATVVTMIISWIRYKKPDVSVTLNGSLAGLVAITAGCDAVGIVGAFIIGVIAAFVVVFGVELIDKVLHIDDPVGAVTVHGMCGAIGTICVGIFATGKYGTNGIVGAIFGDNTVAEGFKQVGVQALGVVSVAAFVAISMFIIFLLIKKTIGLRVTAEEEVKGLDICEHGLASSYADFMPLQLTSDNAPMVTDVPKPVKSTSVTGKMNKVVILTNEGKFNTLKQALNEIGITGMTVTRVQGCGMQKGGTEFYRGVEMEVHLLPKIQVDVVVCKVPVDLVVDTARKVLYSGSIGDGKIFVYEVEQAIKIRTGEEGYDALQDE